MKKVKQFFKNFRIGFKEFGLDITRVVNVILLTVVYFIGVGITALFAKIFRKHFLDLKFDKKAKTYWKDLNLKDNAPDGI